MFNLSKGLPKGMEEFNYEELNIDDAELEKDLEAILGGKQQPTRSANSEQRPAAKTVSNQTTPATRVVPQRPKAPQPQNLYDFNIEALNNLNLNDDDNVDDDDDNFDENDPELVAQLAAIVGDDQLPTYSPEHRVPSAPSNQQQQLPEPMKPTRPAPYQPPANNNQTTSNQTSINQPNSSNCLMLDNSHFTGAKPLVPQQPQQPQISRSDHTKEQLIKWKDEYKRLAIDAKQKNQLDDARAFLRKLKEIENAIESLENGLQIDSSTLTKPDSIQQKPSQQLEQRPEISDSETKKLFKVPDEAPATMLEALNQRKQRIEASLAKEQAANNTSKVRMLGRLIKQYETAIKANKAGRQFDYASLPELPGFPELPLDNKPIANKQATGPVKSEPVQQVQPSVPQSSKNSPGKSKEQLEKWKDEFKTLAINAKRDNDIEKAKMYLQKMKDVSLAIENLENGRPVDLSLITPPVTTSNIRPSEPRVSQPPQSSGGESLLEALELRKAKFQSTFEREQAANNTPRAKMMSRIVKQYEQAIRTCKLNKDFDYTSLPGLPEFGDLPIPDAGKVSNSIQEEPKQQPVRPPPPQAPAAAQPTAEARVKPPFKRTTSINNKQLEYLLQRQTLFKEAAVQANKEGNTTQALDYLKKSKGFAPLIDAVRNGLPIDVSNIPIPPQLEGDDFVMVSKSSDNLNKYLDLDTEEHYRKLELELEKQIDLCDKNKEHFFKIGDVSTGSKFEKYLIDMKKDYEMLKSYKQRGEDVPKYRYELKEFSIVVCNTELSNNEVLFEVIRAIDLPCKQAVDSYVKFEFPFPKDTPQPARTHSAKNTLYPEYNQSFKFSIDRKARSLARVFTKTIKMEIWSKGGFFKADELIGHANVDLSSLRTKCTIFDSFPILSGRKEIGGKLQVRIKLREPLLSKQVEVIREKWLVFTY